MANKPEAIQENQPQKEEQLPSVSPKKRELSLSITKKGLMITLIFVLISGLLAGAGYFYIQYQKAQQEILGIKTDPNAAQKAAEEQVNSLTKEVGKLMDLPANEQPTVATVSDVSKLKDQPFFQNAKNGDKVLIYSNAKRAILYDPLAKKIVDVAPLNIASQSAQIQSTLQDKIALKNGTNTSGLTTKYETMLKKVEPNVTVVSRDNAAKTDYDTSIIVGLTPAGKQDVDALSKALSLQVGDLPSGEVKPDNADILIILGTDNVTK